MSVMAKILYSGFYDFPLAFTVRFEGKLYVFVRGFDDDADEYEDRYRVYFMPPLTDEDIQASWLQIETKAIDYLGEMAVKDIVFDATKRHEIETDVLERLLANAPRELAGAARL